MPVNVLVTGANSTVAQSITWWSIFRPMASTVPDLSSTTMKSPTSKGLSMTMVRDAKISPRIFWTARATAIPPMPSTSSKRVSRGPRADRNARSPARVVGTDFPIEPADEAMSARLRGRSVA